MNLSGGATMGKAGELIARLRSTLPVCPYDRRSPDYWTTPDDKPCVVCGQENTTDGPNKCRGADTRCMAEAATLLASQEAENEALRKSNEEAQDEIDQLNRESEAMEVEIQALTARAAINGLIKPEAVKWSPRGIGLNWAIPDLVTGKIHDDVRPDMSGFARTKAEAGILYAFFGCRAKLDWRKHEPNWIQVKVSADEAVLAKLERLVRDNDCMLTEEIVAQAIAVAKESQP